MRVINHTQFARNKRQRKRWPRFVLYAGLALVIALVGVNVAMAVMYKGRVLPYYSVGAVNVGGVAYTALSQRVTTGTVLSRTVALIAPGKTLATTDPAAWGITPDIAATTKQLQQSRPLLPMLSLFTHHTVPVVVRVNSAAFAAQAQRIEPEYTRPATGKHIVFKDGAFRVAEPQSGYRLDMSRLQTVLADAYARGDVQALAPLVTITDTPAAIDTQAELQKLQKQLGVTISYVYGTKIIQPTAADIGNWFKQSGNTMALSEDAVRTYITAQSAISGVAPLNVSEAVTATVYALTKSQTLHFRLASAQGTIVYRYCAAQRGLDDSVLPAFKLKLAATYGDTRGWNDNGKITFVYSEAGCQLHAWLASPTAILTFGSICDDYYSCTVHPNVVINYGRWTGATDPWNAQHLNIEEYDAMVINHESGHWLGFDHVACPGAGQPAPVMQQQSVNLGGCTFNAWPLASEADAAAR